jgi:hypothetical protein
MKNINSGLLLAGALLLAGCATNAVEGAPGGTSAVAQEQAAGNKLDDSKLTGSRLAKRSTDRMLKSVGAQEARNAMDSNPRPLKGE